jgi:hypothetical protein
MSYQGQEKRERKKKGRKGDGWKKEKKKRWL